MKKKSRIHAFLASFLALFALTPIALGDFVSGGGGGNEANLPVATTEERAVCYVGSTRYTSLSKAIELTSSGTIFVYPELKNADETLYTVSLDASCTLKSGVTLSLPYSGETVFDSNAHAASGNDFADASTSAVKTNRKTQVLFQPGVVLTMESGSVLNIGGILAGPGQALAGQTSSSYCEITLSNGAGIDCNGGNINCYGYIKQTSNTASTFVNINSGKLHSPFVIYDFKGGTATRGITNLKSNQFCPFVKFDICNLQTTVKIVTGSTWETRALIYISTNSTYYPTADSDRIITFVGSSTSNTALILSSGYLLVRYVPSVNGITTGGDTSGSTSIQIFGTAALGYLTISLSISGKKVTIDTNNYYFPVSYRLQIAVENGGVFNIGKRAKIMTGSSLHVKKGGTLNVTSALIAYSSFTETTDGLPSPYPSKPAASFVVDGTMNVSSSGSFGGLIQVTTAGATLTYSSSTFSVSSPEYGGSMPSKFSALLGSACKTKQVSETAMGLLTNGSDLSRQGNIEQRSYHSVENPLSPGEFAWYREGLS